MTSYNDMIRDGIIKLLDDTDPTNEHKLQLDINTYLSNGIITGFYLPGLNYKTPLFTQRVYPIAANRPWNLQTYNDTSIEPISYMNVNDVTISILSSYNISDWAYYSIGWHFPLDAYARNILIFNVYMMYDYAYKLGAYSINFIFTVSDFEIEDNTEIVIRRKPSFIDYNYEDILNIDTQLSHIQEVMRDILAIEMTFNLYDSANVVGG